MDNRNDPKGFWGYGGLTGSIVDEKIRQGLVNHAEPPSSQTYKEILARNLFTAFNFVMILIGAMLMGFGLYSDALMSVALIFLNVVIGLAQEIRAKKKLDEIALLTRPRITVIRDGKEASLDPSQVVQGDLLLFRPGDQLVVDGKILREEGLRVDESLITGESDPVPRKEGDEVFSGSYCVSGVAVVETEKVGLESLVNRLATGAKSYRQILTPLQQDVNLVIKILMMAALLLGFLKAVSSVLNGIPLIHSVQSAAVIAGIVPIGLFMAVIVAYSLGAVRIAGKGALVQQSNAIESLSHVDVLCMDKTGTITANRIRLERIVALNGNDEEVKRLLGGFAASVSLANRTADAINESLKGEKQETAGEVPFSSEWKWSALCFVNKPGTLYLLGAWEAFKASLGEETDKIEPMIKEAAAKGLRVLMFCEAPAGGPLFDKDENPLLPPGIVPHALVLFSDELRTSARDTLKKLADANIRLKIISGDSPETIGALARQAGMTGELRLVSGPDLERMSLMEQKLAAREGVIFGRVTPQQKEFLIQTLREQGKYVAMIGDGVNDVLALKKANLGVTLQSGTGVARSVSDIVLLNDSFEAIPLALIEGRRIVNGMRSILSLYMTRSLYVALIIVAAEFVGAGFPYAPKQAALLSILTVGIPSFAFALWARPEFPRKRLLYSVLHYVLPATFSIVVFGLLVYTLYFYLVQFKILSIGISQQDIEAYMKWAGLDYTLTGEGAVYEMSRAAAQMILTHFTILSGLLLIVFVEPPIPLFTGGNHLSSDRKPAYLALAIFVIYAISLTFRSLHFPLEVLRLTPFDYLFVSLVTLVWALLLRSAWRSRLLERFLQIDFEKTPE